MALKRNLPSPIGFVLVERHRSSTSPASVARLTPWSSGLTENMLTHAQKSACTAQDERALKNIYAELWRKGHSTAAQTNCALSKLVLAINMCADRSSPCQLNSILH